MKSLTIHALDEQLSTQIRNRAREESISMNELVKRILAEALGLKAPAIPPHQADFDEFFGTWSDADLQEFESGITDSSTVDPEDWA